MRTTQVYLFAIALALSGCSAGYDCRTKAVHEKLFSILRDNFYEVLRKSDEPGLKGLATMAGLLGLVAGVAEMADQQNLDGTFDRRIVDQLRAFPQTARFSLNSLTEEDDNQDGKKHSCRANVRIEATIPDQFADALRQLPFLGVNAKGEVAGNIDVRFTVQPDLSGKSEFVIRATW
jgi:hypothetical protein